METKTENAQECVAALRVAEVARALGVTTQTVRNWGRSGRLRTTRLGKFLMVPRADYDRLVREVEGDVEGEAREKAGD